MQLCAGEQGWPCKVWALAGGQPVEDVRQVLAVALLQALLCQIQQEGHARRGVAKAAERPDYGGQVTRRQPSPPVAKTVLLLAQQTLNISSQTRYSSLVQVAGNVPLTTHITALSVVQSEYTRRHGHDMISLEVCSWTCMPSISRRSMTSEALSRYGAGGLTPSLLNAHSRLDIDCTGHRGLSPPN